MKLKALLLAGALALAAHGAFAGPIQDGEAEVGQVYALYRKALFSTNQKDVGAARADLEALTTRWNAFAARWASAAPAHYAADAALPATFSRVGAALAGAAARLATGDNAAAHDALEPIRDELQAMRARNGVASFSDEMNAYHAAMEHAVDRWAQAKDVDFGALREEAAVLAHLAGRLAARAPAAYAAAPEFRTLLDALQGSVKALLEAARAGDAEAARKAAGALKRPYSQLFVKFG